MVTVAMLMIGIVCLSASFATITWSLKLLTDTKVKKKPSEVAFLVWAILASIGLVYCVYIVGRALDQAWGLN